MARSIQDVTTIYRFKTTHTFTQRRDGWGRKAGELVEKIDFIGPYSRKIPWAGWTPNNGTFKVERQQLRPANERPEAEHEIGLEWVTIEVKHYEPETDDDA